MKKIKTWILIILGAILLVFVILAVCIGQRVIPTVNHALQIAELLRPMQEAENQTMHLDISAEVNGTPLILDSDIFLVTEDEMPFLAMEQKGAAIYVWENVLFLENGKAFRIGDKLQTTAFSYPDLLPYIGSLYETLKITAQEQNSGTTYSVTVTGEQVETLLEIASLANTLPADGIDGLQLQLTEKNGRLDTIVFSGSGWQDGTDVQLCVTVSGFRILAPGDYPIPEAVKLSAATVDPDSLFSLTEDLYRLVLALAPFADMESIDGTLALAVDCGLIQLHTSMRLSDLKTFSDPQIDPEKLQALPQLLGWLCMEGDIRCIQNGNFYEYVLALDQQAMQDLSLMILPELGQYSDNLTAGSVTILLENDEISSMEVSIAGEISVLVVQVPLTVSAAFTF